MIKLRKNFNIVYNGIGMLVSPQDFHAHVDFVDKQGFDLIGFVRKFYGDFGMLLLIARRKYAKNTHLHFPSSQVVLSQSFVTDLSKLPQKVASLWSRVYFFDNEKVPNYVKSMYFIPIKEPHRAIYTLMQSLLQRQQEILSRAFNEKEIDMSLWLNAGNVVKQAYSALHKIAHSPMFLFDIDFPEETQVPKDFVDKVVEFFKGFRIEPEVILKTRSGYHILVSKVCGEKIFRQDFHIHLKSFVVETVTEAEVEFKTKPTQYLLPYMPHGGKQIELVYSFI